METVRGKIIRKSILLQALLSKVLRGRSSFHVVLITCLFCEICGIGSNLAETSDLFLGKKEVLFVARIKILVTV